MDSLKNYIDYIPEKEREGFSNELSKINERFENNDSEYSKLNSIINELKSSKDDLSSKNETLMSNLNNLLEKSGFQAPDKISLDKEKLDFNSLKKNQKQNNEFESLNQKILAYEKENKELIETINKMNEDNRKKEIESKFSNEFKDIFSKHKGKEDAYEDVYYRIKRELNFELENDKFIFKDKNGNNIRKDGRDFNLEDYIVNLKKNEESKGTPHYFDHNIQQVGREFKNEAYQDAKGVFNKHVNKYINF